ERDRFRRLARCVMNITCFGELRRSELKVAVGIGDRWSEIASNFSSGVIGRHGGASNRFALRRANETMDSVAGWFNVRRRNRRLDLRCLQLGDQPCIKTAPLR